jgi:hypothetical protein
MSSSVTTVFERKPECANERARKLLRLLVSVSSDSFFKFEFERVK